MEENIKFIHKYMTFAQFVDLIENERLYFSNIDNWEDCYEGKYIYKILDKYVDLEHRNNEFRELNIAKCQMIIKSTYAQSWTLDEKESDAMWRIYSTDKLGVRVTFNIKDIKECIDNKFEGNQKVEGYMVDYLDNDEIEEYLDRQLTTEGMNISSKNFCNIKRRAFEHEKEYRFSFVTGIPSKVELFIKEANLKENKDTLMGTFEILKRKYLNGVIYYKVPINKINKVLLDPRAPKYFKETFNQYCKGREFIKNGIKYRQSELYQFS